MTQTIKNLKEGTFEGEALLTEKNVGTAKNGSQYADLTFSDKTGSIRCKKWALTPFEDQILKPGYVFGITMDISTYQGNLQGNVKAFWATQTPIANFVKATRFSVEEMFEEVLQLALSMQEPLTRMVTNALLDKHKDAIKKAPAAKAQHNAWVGGLIEHIWSMCQCAKPILKHYSESYNQKISKDKVIFGLCAHDLGKIIEYEYESGAISYAPRGLLTPHIVAGCCWVYEEANKIWASPAKPIMSVDGFVKERDHLVHIVASHHGSLEWGSPVVPASLEAILVHQLDMIDSKFMHALELVEGKDGQIPGFSEKSWSEKTSFMKYDE